jgi:ABC-type dipeptide/oligopeptide/nickel transport system permease component
MKAFLVRRLISTLAAALALSMFIFLLIRLVPGDAVTMWVGQRGR